MKQSLQTDSEFFSFLHDSEWSPLKGSIPYIQALFRMLSKIQGLVALTTFDFEEKVTLIETLPDLLLTLHLYQVKLSSGSSLSDRVEWSVIYNSLERTAKRIETLGTKLMDATTDYVEY